MGGGFMSRGPVKFKGWSQSRLLPEQIHRVGKHGVGRPGSVHVLLHGNAALNEIHDGLQVAQSFGELFFLGGGGLQHSN